MTASDCSGTASPRGRPEAGTSHWGLMCQRRGLDPRLWGTSGGFWFLSSLHFGQLSESSLEGGGGREAIRRSGWGPEDISSWQTRRTEPVRLWLLPDAGRGEGAIQCPALCDRLCDRRGGEVNLWCVEQHVVEEFSCGNDVSLCCCWSFRGHQKVCPGVWRGQGEM